MGEDSSRKVGSVLVIGSVNEDVVLRVPRSPQPGETLTATEVNWWPGGKGANQAVAAARGGAEVQMIARVGDDAAGRRMIAALREGRVDADSVKALPDVTTGTAYITVTDDGENTIVVEPGANARLSPQDVEAERELIGAAAVILSQLEVPVPTVARAVQLAVQQGVRPVVTLAPAQEVPDELLAGLDPLLVNEHEAAFLLDEQAFAGDAEKAATRLLDLGPRSVVITLGAEGAVLADGGGARRLPARPVDEVLDTTGAGDAFAGAMAAALAAGRELGDAVEAGLVAAAEAVGRLGPR